MSAPFLPHGRIRLSGNVLAVAVSCLAAIALSLSLGVAPAWAQPKSPLTIRAGGQEATILADQIQEVGGANELLIAVGNVEITQGQSRLLADRVELNRDTGQAVAQGRVVFFDGGDRLVGDRVDYNLKSGTGVVHNASTFSAPYYRLSAERMDRVGPGLYNVYRGVFTTCEGDEPAWSFKMGSGFFIREMLRSSGDRAQLDVPENRGFFSYKHDWQIMPRLSLKVDANATTDDLVFREYGDFLQDRSRQRAETNVFLSQAWDTWSLVANVLWYQDLTIPVATELQRVPEIKLQGLRQPVPGAPYLQYETQASFTNFLRAVGDGGVRLDVHPRVFLPVPVAGLFTLTPFAGWRTTYYNQRALGLSSTRGVTVEDTIHEDRVRLQAEGGVEAETRASRVFQLDGAGGIAALQHVIEPRMTLLQIRGINQKANPQFDPSIDRIGRVNEITYSLTNRLNAKTGSGPNAEPVRWEMVRFVVSQTLNLRRAISQGQPFEDLTGDLIIQPNTIFRFRAEAAYNLYGVGLRSANTDLTATYRDVALTVGSRFNDISGVNYVRPRCPPSSCRTSTRTPPSAMT